MKGRRLERALGQQRRATANITAKRCRVVRLYAPIILSKAADGIDNERQLTGAKIEPLPHHRRKRLLARSLVFGPRFEVLEIPCGAGTQARVSTIARALLQPLRSKFGTPHARPCLLPSHGADFSPATLAILFLTLVANAVESSPFRLYSGSR